MPAAANGDAKTNGNANSHSHNDGSSTRTFTIEQKAAVIRVRKCSPTAFYDILGLETTKTSCTDNEIKKAYRKLSLLTHPDKNGYDGADEAFKMVSRAFQVLSDPDKKCKFDRFGGDPESRFGAGGGGGGSAAAASPFAGFGGGMGGRGGGMFEEEISPEEMFRQFFGGGGMGGPFGGGLFDTGPGFVFNLGGGPGLRVHQFGGNRPRRRPHNHADGPPPSPLATLQSLLPLLLIFVFPIISSLFGGLFGDSTPSGPQFRFDPAPPFTQHRSSSSLKVPYYVKPVDVTDFDRRQWKSLDKRVENRHLQTLQYECEVERDQQQRMLNEAMGFFWSDHDKINRAHRLEMRSCRKLEGYGYRLR